MFFIIGVGIALGETLNRTGATAWLKDIVSPAIMGGSLVFTLTFLIFTSALLTNVINNATVVAVFVPILISLASADPSFNAVQLVLPMTLATTFGYSLPSASGRMALISAMGIVDRSEMIRYGMILTVLSSAALVLVFYVMMVLGVI